MCHDLILIDKHIETSIYVRRMIAHAHSVAVFGLWVDRILAKLEAEGVGPLSLSELNHSPYFRVATI